jgi:hypothetical protein
VPRIGRVAHHPSETIPGFRGEQAPVRLVDPPKPKAEDERSLALASPWPSVDLGASTRRRYAGADLRCCLHPSPLRGRRPQMLPPPVAATRAPTSSNIVLGRLPRPARDGKEVVWGRGSDGSSHPRGASKREHGFGRSKLTRASLVEAVVGSKALGAARPVAPFGRVTVALRGIPHCVQDCHSGSNCCPLQGAPLFVSIAHYFRRAR